MTLAQLSKVLARTWLPGMAVLSIFSLTSLTIACEAQPGTEQSALEETEEARALPPGTATNEIADDQIDVDVRGVEFRKAQVLVQFEDDVSESAKAAARASVNATTIENLDAVGPVADGARNLEVILVDQAGRTIEATLETLRAQEGVRFAEADWIYKHNATPNDPNFAQLWGLNNVGQRIGGGGGGTVDVDMDGTQAFDIDGARQVFVGIIDEGIDFRHPDLAGIVINPGEDANKDGRITQADINGLDDDGNGIVDDVHGFDFANRDNTVFDGAVGDNATDAHGTHVSGTIGAVPNNGIGIAGVAPTVRVISGKFLGANGGATSDAVRAIDYFTDLKLRGVNIVATNNSWGGGGFSRALQDAVERANRAGILFIAAAGNGGNDGVGDNNDQVASFPSNLPNANVIAVAAIDRTGRLTRFSNFGVAQVDVAAPGAAILSTTPNGTFSFFDGTSMATPHVTGLAALLAATQNLSAAQIKTRILTTVVPTQALQGRVATGGRVNAFRALSNSKTVDP